MPNDNDTQVVYLEIDYKGTEDLDEKLKILRDFSKTVHDKLSEGFTRFVISFEKVDYLHEELGPLAQIYKSVRKAKGKIALCCLTPSIHQVFKVTKLDKMYPILPTVEKATKKVSKKPGGFIRKFLSPKD